MATLFVHIGTPKTGTSSIQDFLKLNQENLKKNGICYPHFDLDFAKSKFKLHRNGNFLVHHAVELQGEEKTKKEQRIYRQGFGIIKDVAKHYEKIVVTDEAIWYRQNEKNDFWQRVMEDAKENGCTLKVIVYLRRQDLYIEAWYNQAVKFYPRSAKTFGEFVQSNVIFEHNLDYYQKLKEIADIIGRENLIIKVFEKQLFISSKDGLYRDFLDAMGEQMRQEYILPGRIVNDGLRGNYVEIKRMMNEVPEYQQMADFMKVPVIHASNMVPQEKVSYFDHEEKVKFLSRYEESNRRTAKEFLGMESGVMFTEPVEQLPKWEIDYGTMYQDIIHVFTEVCVEQQRQIQRLEKRLQNGVSNKFLYRCKNCLKKLYRKIRKRF